MIKGGDINKIICCQAFAKMMRKRNDVFNSTFDVFRTSHCLPNFICKKQKKEKMYDLIIRFVNFKRLFLFYMPLHAQEVLEADFFFPCCVWEMEKNFGCYMDSYKKIHFKILYFKFTGVKKLSNKDKMLILQDNLTSLLYYK